MGVLNGMLVAPFFGARAWVEILKALPSKVSAGKLSDYATARRKRPTETGKVAERVVEAAQQGSQERAAADLRREQDNTAGKSASMEKADQPGDSGESGKAFVSKPVAASRRTVARTREGEGAGVKPTAAMHGATRFTIGWLMTPRLSVREKLRFVRSGDHREVDPNMDAILADRS